MPQFSLVRSALKPAKSLSLIVCGTRQGAPKPAGWSLCSAAVCNLQKLVASFLMPEKRQTLHLLIFKKCKKENTCYTGRSAFPYSLGRFWMHPDFSKAFATVSKSSLITKLVRSGLDSCMRRWVRCWLDARTQRAVIGSAKSS